MVLLFMQLLKRDNFYYLGHTFRDGKKVSYKEKYIGIKIPDDIVEIKEEFLRNCLSEAVFSKLKHIKENYNKEWHNYPDSIKKKMLLDFSIEFTYNTNRIEGSTITFEETEELLKRKISPHKPIDDVKETLNNSKIFFEIFESNQEFSSDLLKQWHCKLFCDTKNDIAGKYREYRVKVGKYIAPDWQDVPQLMADFFRWYNENKDKINPVELSARAHYRFEKIHPFGDGNGRIGRLIITYILQKNNYPLLTIEYKKRKSYYKALGQLETKFMYYFFRRYLNVHKGYL